MVDIGLTCVEDKFAILGQFVTHLGITGVKMDKKGRRSCVDKYKINDR